MTWSSSGGVATFPNEQPPLLNATGRATLRYPTSSYQWGNWPAQPLTFRKDPASGIVYVTGWWDVTNLGTAINQSMSFLPTSYALPAQFRPKSVSWLTMKYWPQGGTETSNLLWVQPNGTLAPVGTQTVPINFAVIGTYFTDV